MHKFIEYLDNSTWSENYALVDIERLYTGSKDSNYKNRSGYVLIPKDSLSATDALMMFNSIGERCSYASITDGYRLKLTGSVSEAGGRLTVQTKVPAVLNAGNLHAIEWTGSAHLKLGAYGITGSLTIGSTTYDESYIFASYDEFAAFLTENESAVYNAMNQGTFDVFVNAIMSIPGTVTDGVYVSQMSRSFLPLILRAEVGGSTVERTLSVDIASALGN